ncbi:MAG: PEP-CTERM sorting domain-containing protein [Fimbriimonadaceae bacterium]
MKQLKSYFVVTALAAASVATANLLVPDFSGDRVMLFSSQDGSLIDENFITDEGAVGWQFSSPKAALDLGNGEIWVTDQLEDSVFRFDYSGNYLGGITEGLDNVRGIRVIGDQVWVLNGGSNNDAPGTSVIRLDFDGNNLGFFALPESSWDVAPHGDNVLISDWGNDDLMEYDLDGNFIGNFTNHSNLFNPQQINQDGENYLVGGFGAPESAIYQYAADGTLLNSWAEGFGPRAAYRLGNGDILWTKGDGVFVLDPSTDTFFAAQSGANAQYISYTAVPEPATMLALAAGLGLLAARRRNRK